MSHSRRQVGMSLIEVVVFIIVLGIGFTGMLVLYNQITKGSVDPMVRKQALALASSLLEEIELHAFTYCDPDDPKVYTATAATAAECTAAAYVEGIGPNTLPLSTAETRYAAPRFDNVNDYHGFEMGAGTGNPMLTIDSNPIVGLDDYRVAVGILNAGGDPSLPNVAVPEDALRIIVVVEHLPTGLSVNLQGYRLRYAPNSP